MTRLRQGFGGQARAAKAVSLWQPWAGLLVLTIDGVRPKTFETRSWATAWRGELLVHAAARVAKVDERQAIEQTRGRLGGANLELLNQALDDPLCWHRGALIGRVTLVDCFDAATLVDRGQVSALDQALGVWWRGRSAWLTRDPEIFDPIPLKGRQRLFDVPMTALTRRQQ